MRIPRKSRPPPQAILRSLSARYRDSASIGLDGAGAGIFGALTPLVIADIMRGTGRYNLAQGAVATAQGIGASLSGLTAGVIVDHYGYAVTFLTLGAIAAVALIVFAIGMQETANQEQ
jgi:MFS family permease